MSQQASADAARAGTTPRWWWVAAPAAVLVLVALCLRAPFAAVGPLLGELGDDLGLSTGALAVVTALPLVCFGLVSPFAPALAARFGVHGAVLVGVALIAAGVLLRVAGAPGLFIGTVLLSGGIAVGNVLLPAAAREEYGARAAVVLGLITASMSGSAALGAGLARPLSSAAGGPGAGLLLWGVLVLVALLAMGALARARRGAPRPGAAPSGGRTAILRDRVALAVTLYFGFQSLSFYAMLTWLADVLESESGVSPVAAGGLLAVATGLAVPLALVIPGLAGRRPGQQGWILLGALPAIAAITGLLLAPEAAPLLWAALYGFGSGVAFPLSIMLIVARSRDVAQTGRLSATAQSVGYLLAATGPLGVGLLHDATGAWAPGLLLMLTAVVLQLVVGLAAARPRLLSPAA
ncbi:MFS transporter, CP family, cyanate transporter [Blastococcus aggregatus]|uniref:MFS transporter, CP family, cyanate transporter n=1 Tax=Blastococcus aggregatus TaxID=38502 RepID=A0A285V115_9ACTN|nr:MFS transporter [Blastococcus aggregatus]SOC47855.1 MFS transporter, CP family, cyanate transporter [Blastococcus aggregatus]